MIYPSLEQFRRWANRYSIVPFFCKFPLKANDFYPYFLSSAPENQTSFFLDSSNLTRAGNESHYSYFPLTQPQQQILAMGREDFPASWNALRKFFRLNCGPELASDLPPFYGGGVGIFSYDSGRSFETGWKSAAPPDSLQLPQLQFNMVQELACFDHKMSQVFFFSCLPIKKMGSKRTKKIYQEQQKRLIQLAEQSKKRFFSKRLPEKPKSAFFHNAPNPILRIAHRLNNRSRFIRAVHKIKRYIAAGDIYQANLSHRIESKFKGSSLDFYARLRRINPSPYACFFQFPHYDIASCSPELLLKKRGAILETRPIAGTRPRGQDSLSDEQMSAELLLSEKERAEHIMLLDLERNDLGRVCKSGSVQVSEKMAVEKYSHVMHIVSKVCGELKKEEDIFSALAAVFPGGTITGCPKVRCMQILDEIEPVARGPFFGSAGWIGYQGNAEFNLLIRTAVIKRSEDRNQKLEIRKNERRDLNLTSDFLPPTSKIFIQVGSGIVADSDPELEYQESLHKAHALLEALKMRR